MFGVSQSFNRQRSHRRQTSHQLPLGFVLPRAPWLPPQPFPADRTPLGGLVATATSIGGKQVQQDACAHLDLPGCKVVAVADGISSSPDAHLAAQTAVQIALQALTLYWQAGYPITPSILKQAFFEAQAIIRLQVQARRLTHAPPATTLIVAVELVDRFLVAYVGDGAAVLATGNLKLGLMNILYPHMRTGGAITCYLGSNQGWVEPACLEFPKCWPEGGILLVGTDGALPLGQLLKMARPILEQVQRHVMDSLSSGGRVDPHPVLESWVTRHLTTDDNRTLGLIVSEEALNYWRTLAAQKSGGHRNATEPQGCAAAATQPDGTTQRPPR